MSGRWHAPWCSSWHNIGQTSLTYNCNCNPTKLRTRFFMWLLGMKGKIG